MVGSGREFDESEAVDTTGESVEKEYSFERKRSIRSEKGRWEGKVKLR